MEPLYLNAIKASTIILFMCLLGCHNTKSQNRDTNKIVALLVDRTAKPIIPPPPPGLPDSLFRAKADYIHKMTETRAWQDQEFIVGLDILMVPLASKIVDSIAGYNDLVKKLNDLKDTLRINIKDIAKTRGVKLKPVPIDSSGKTDYQYIDMRISFSGIVYNKDHSRAALVMGVGRGRLNGYASLLILEKVGNEWQVVKDRVLVIS